MNEESKVCVNEICDFYCRLQAFKFQNSFLHCPYCAGKLVTETKARILLKQRYE